MPKITISPERSVRMLHSIQLIGLFAECVLIEFQHDLTDKMLKSPVMNNKAGRIRKDAEAILAHLRQFATVRDADRFSYEHAAQIHRMVKFYSTLPTDRIEEFMNGVEQMALEEAIQAHVQEGGAA